MGEDTSALLFEALTPVGFRVRLRRAYWELLTGIKHPVMARGTDMAEVKVYYDQTGNTLTVWFGNPQDEYICEETGAEVILMKDKAGKVIGFEKLNFSATKPQPLHVAFEASAT